MALYDYVSPLLTQWQERGLLALEADQARLTTAGSFWNINMAQGLINALRLSPPLAA
ncbi:hypothetical protein PCI56_07365 [Plesiomonas shigelloides subsp. oncorhynchi]|nr:hypothetical protein [Plesiomonas shigelloides]